MPPGTPHNSFLGPYRIRVDDFSTPRDASFETPALQLLTHTHSDHVTGLAAKSFGSRVICSVDTKHMLLNGEPAAARIAFDSGEVTEKTRPYAHLKIDAVTKSGGKRERTHSRDLLCALPINTPVGIELSDGLAVTITLIDANHCPGAVMFLVEGPLGNFLHTGDVRAEPAFLASLARNPCLQRYISPPISFLDPATCVGEKPLRTLDAVYLDTACLLSNKELPSKEEVCTGIVKLISRFPPPTRFFINSWTWGYEDILKAIGQAFNCQIHVDRYKYIIYSGISDPLLKSLVTRNPESTRFHACERWNRCNQVEHDAGDVVFVNPVTMSKAQWDLYFDETQTHLTRGDHVRNLICPLSRHSSLPELRALVKLFRPKLVVPNFLNPRWGNLDWACMPRMFRDCMAEGGPEAIISDMRNANVDIATLMNSTVAIDVAEEAEIQNLVGDGAEELVKLWTDSSRTDSGRVALSEGCSGAEFTWTKLEQSLGRGALQELSKRFVVSEPGQDGECEDSDCDGAAEARGRVAGTFAPASPTSNRSQGALILYSPISSNPPPPTPCRQISPSEPRLDSGKQFATSLVPESIQIRHENSSMSVPPFLLRISSDCPNEQAFHSFFDCLQFGAGTSSSSQSISLALGKRVEHPHVARTADSSAMILRSPCPISSLSLAKTRTFDISHLRFMSPSVTPSPTRAPRTLSGQTLMFREIPLSNSKFPPHLNLKKVLKRTSSTAGLRRPVVKRRTGTVNPLSTALGVQPVGDPLTHERRFTLQHVALPPLEESVPRRHSSSSGPFVPTFSRAAPLHARKAEVALVANSSSCPPCSDAEKQRRQKAKKKQIDITMKLVSALPPGKVAPACKARMEMRAKVLAERRARQKSMLIAARKSVYGVADDTSRSNASPAAAQGLQKQPTVIDDQSADWGKSKEFEEEIRRQRMNGSRYPELPRSEKSFMWSQSPSQ